MKKRLKQLVREPKGQLIVEALLATVILGVGITVIVQAMTSSLRATVYSGDYTKAIMLLDSKFTETLLTVQDSFSSVSDGKFPEPFDKFKYTVDAQDVSGANNSNLEQMTIDVSWKSGIKDNRLYLDTYRFKAVK